MRSSVLKTFIVVLLVSITLFPWVALADTLYMSPLTANYSVGDSFSIRILVSSPRQSVNAVSGELSFPADKLQVTSVSKIGSILSLWVQEPTFSNSRGTVTFEGVVPNPGFSESEGRILAINFRVVGTGAAQVKFNSGSLLANDGMGTNILKTLGTGNFTLNQKQVLPITPPALLEGEVNHTEPPPPAPVVVSTPNDSQTERELFKGWNMPPIKTILTLLIGFLSLVIPLVALAFLLTHTAVRGTYSIRKLRRKMRTDLHHIERLVEKTFDIMKEDISDSIHLLERTRRRRQLTPEEESIAQRLKQNLVEAEAIIHKEILKAEKDLDD